MAVGHRVIVLIEADVRCLADRDRHLLDHRSWIVRQRQQVRRFLGEDFADRAVGSSGQRRSAAGPQHQSSACALRSSRSVNCAGGKEAIPYVAHGAFDPAFFVTAGDGDGARLVTVMPGEVEQGGIEADRVAAALQHGTFQIVVQNDTGNTASMPRRRRHGRAGSSPCGRRGRSAGRSGASSSAP